MIIKIHCPSASWVTRVKYPGPWWQRDVTADTANLLHDLRRRYISWCPGMAQAAALHKTSQSPLVELPWPEAQSSDLKSSRAWSSVQWRGVRLMMVSNALGEPVICTKPLDNGQHESQHTHKRSSQQTHGSWHRKGALAATPALGQNRKCSRPHCSSAILEASGKGSHLSLSPHEQVRDSESTHRLRWWPELKDPGQSEINWIIQYLSFMISPVSRL